MLNSNAMQVNLGAQNVTFMTTGVCVCVRVCVCVHLEVLRLYGRTRRR